MTPVPEVSQLADLELLREEDVVHLDVPVGHVDGVVHVVQCTAHLLEPPGGQRLGTGPAGLEVAADVAVLGELHHHVDDAICPPDVQHLDDVLVLHPDQRLLLPREVRVLDGLARLVEVHALQVVKIF